MTRRRTHRRASPAQRAARARFAAMARARSHKRMSNPRRRRAVVHHRRRNPIHLFSAPRRHHRRRRNPSSRVGGMGGLLKAAMWGSVGAVGVDAVFNLIPIPMLTTGTVGMVAKAGAALLLGTAGRGMFGNAATEMAVGSLTVQFYRLLQQFLPAGITGLGYTGAGITGGAPAAVAAPAATSPALAGMGMYVGGMGAGMGLGEYVQ